MDGVTYKGKVQKEYAGFVKEMFTLADNFSIDLRTMKQPVITEDYIDLEFNGETIWKNEGCNLEQKEPLTFIDIE